MISSTRSGQPPPGCVFIQSNTPITARSFWYLAAISSDANTQSPAPSDPPTFLTRSTSGRSQSTGCPSWTGPLATPGPPNATASGQPEKHATTNATTVSLTTLIARAPP